MQSFDKKYEGQELEILNHINDECGGDINAGMWHFDARDTIAWRKFIDKITEKFKFRIIPRNRKAFTENYLPLDMQLAQAFLHKVSLLKTLANLRAESKRLDKRIESLQLQLLEAGETKPSFAICELTL